jgi:FAD/FMN-containing dehydrogenase
MKRRKFLDVLAATVSTAIAPMSMASNGGGTTQALGKPLFKRVRPGDAGWPSASSWAHLAQELGGHLHSVTPLFGPCQRDPASVACGNASQQRDNPFWIGDQAGGTQNSGWFDAWTPAPSAFAIEARHANDVASGVRFASKNALRLVIKGGGHSYLGTSNAPDSLLIWTRRMNSVVLHDAFVAKDCAGYHDPVPAVSAGAGAMWVDLYHAVTTQAGRYVQGGGCMTVGVAGLVQSGGFNSFSKAFGTAAAGLLEAEIVTADGQVRVVNPRKDPDLFWAIQGGGGGTFGVVTRVTLRTHPLPRYFGVAWGRIKARSDAGFAQLIAHFMHFYQERLFNAHWGEHVNIGPDRVLELNMICQGLDPDQVRAIWESFFVWIKQSPDLFDVLSPLGCDAWPARSWWDGQKNPHTMTVDPRPGAPAHHAWSKGDQGELSILLHGYDSLWLSESLLQPDRRQDLCGALHAASRHQVVRLFFGKGLAGASREVRAAARRTATNPAAADAFALVIIADGEKASDAALAGHAADAQHARDNAKAIALAGATLRRIAPEAGSYVSESNYFNDNWQRDYWGRNYPRLLAVKSKYDPAGLFFVYHGVGSEGWSNDGFTRRI